MSCARISDLPEKDVLESQSKPTQRGGPVFQIPECPGQQILLHADMLVIASADSSGRRDKLVSHLSEKTVLRPDGLDL